MQRDPPDVPCRCLVLSSLLCVATAIAFWDASGAPVLLVALVANSLALVRLRYARRSDPAVLALGWLQALLLGLGMGQGWRGSGVLWPAAALLGWAWALVVSEPAPSPVAVGAESPRDTI